MATECRRCNGRGEVYAYGAAVTCIRCMGSGEEPVCPTCDGVGGIPRGGGKQESRRAPSARGSQ